MRPAPGVLHVALYRGQWLVGTEAVEPARVRASASTGTLGLPSPHSDRVGGRGEYLRADVAPRP